MLYKFMMVAHVLGATVWIGGHIVLVAVVLPKAMRSDEPGRILEFERGYGRLGLGALVVQLGTGLWLADRWVGDWSAIFSEPTPAAHLVLSKLLILTITVGIAGYAYHRVLPRVERTGLRAFAVLSGVTTALAVLLLVLGVGIRTGGLI